jgi:hypothetical protein
VKYFTVVIPISLQFLFTKAGNNTVRLALVSFGCCVTGVSEYTNAQITPPGWLRSVTLTSDF